MSAKRPAIDLRSLTSELATPMPEAVQRSQPAAATAKHCTSPEARSMPPILATINLEALAFKVSPKFRRRFRERAVAMDLKLNELLFEALDAWEEKHGFAEKP